MNYNPLEQNTFNQFIPNGMTQQPRRPMTSVESMYAGDSRRSNLVDPQSGEYNGDTKKNLFQNMEQHRRAVTAGLATSAEHAKLTRHVDQVVANILNQDDHRVHEALATAFGDTLWETANREGFMRNLFMRQDVQQNNIPRIPVNKKTTMGYVASSNSQFRPSPARDNFLYPPEFYLGAYVTIGERDIVQSPENLLEIKLLEAQEATMTQEDRIAMRLINKVSSLVNPIMTVRGSITPANLAVARNQLAYSNVPAKTLLIAADIWNDFTGSAAFSSWYDPVTQYEIVQTGRIGNILGLSIISDAFRVPQQRVLNPGDLYVLTEPQFLGGYTDRGNIQAYAINTAATGLGIPARGWTVFELMSMAVLGGAGISYLNRIA